MPQHVKKTGKRANKNTHKKKVKKKAKKKAKRSASLAQPFPSTDRDFEIERGLETLVRAEEMKGDKGLMKDIEALKKKKMSALSNV